MENKEKVVMAAIKFYSNDSPDFPTIMTARRHVDILERLNFTNIYSFNEVEGFWTSKNRFVDRYEAKEIAVAANQLIVPIENTYNALYSEDVW